MDLIGYIQSGLYYKQIITENLKEIPIEELEISELSKFIVKVKSEYMAVCKWVSPKRTRSYPYARVYDILSQHTSKKVAIIPVIKDEGKAGDRDFLQWDTIAMLSLLGVYAIPAYYCWAEVRGEKLTKQKFEYEYIREKLEELASYKHDALHWNIKELKNISEVVRRALKCYRKISNLLGVSLHGERGIKEYLKEIEGNLENFISQSRHKAKRAQVRETKTIQPKELIHMKKASIDIYNYLGGVYHFTVDEVEIKDDHIYLIECKHSKSSVLPSIEDVKDGLLKVMLYKSIDRLELDGKSVSFKIALKLTSLKNKGSLEEAISTIRSERKRDFYNKLLEESEKNQFEVLYYGYG